MSSKNKLPHKKRIFVDHTFVNQTTMKIAVIIPAYKVVHHVEQVILQIDDSVHTIYVVDDCCPKKSDDFVKNI